MLFRRSPSVTPEEAHVAAARGELRLVDVREPHEVAGAPLPGATNVPLRQLPGRLGELAGGGALAFVCRSGTRSAVATRVAAQAGLDAVNVRGGVAAWARAGLPL